MFVADCLFCKIVNREIPSEVVFEDDQVMAFKDINPVAPIHLLVVPKKHLTSLNDVQAGDELLVGHLLKVAKDLAEKFGVAESGYRVVINIGENGGQIIKHLHFHVLGGQVLGTKLG